MVSVAVRTARIRRDGELPHLLVKSSAVCYDFGIGSDRGLKNSPEAARTVPPVSATRPHQFFGLRVQRVIYSLETPAFTHHPRFSERPIPLFKIDLSQGPRTRGTGS